MLVIFLRVKGLCCNKKAQQRKWWHSHVTAQGEWAVTSVACGNPDSSLHVISSSSMATVIIWVVENALTTS